MGKCLRAILHPLRNTPADYPPYIHIFLRRSPSRFRPFPLTIEAKAVSPHCLPARPLLRGGNRRIMLQTTSPAKRHHVSTLAEIEQRTGELHRLAGRPQPKPLIRPSEPEIDPLPAEQSAHAPPSQRSPQPALSEAALYGLAGSAVRTMAPHTGDWRGQTGGDRLVWTPNLRH
jgi:hypothetical protein